MILCDCCGASDVGEHTSDLCAYCASGSCASCAVLDDRGLIIVPQSASLLESTCSMCDGEGTLVGPRSVRVCCNRCAGRGTVTSQPLDGYDQTPISVLETLTSETLIAGN